MRILPNPLSYLTPRAESHHVLDKTDPDLRPHVHAAAVGHSLPAMAAEQFPSWFLHFCNIKAVKERLPSGAPHLPFKESS